MGKIDFNYGLRLPLRSLSKDDEDGNENGKKAIGFRLAIQQLCKGITLFVHFFAGWYYKIISYITVYIVVSKYFIFSTKEHIENSPN